MNTPLPDDTLRTTAASGSLEGPSGPVLPCGLDKQCRYATRPAEACTELGADDPFPWSLADLLRVIGMWLAGAAVIGTLALIAGYIYRRFA